MKRPPKIPVKSRNARLAGVALALGAIAVFGDPYRGDESVTVNRKELAQMVETQVDHVSVQELADWIVQGHSDFRLIDIRDAEAYAAYHIPGAENVPVVALTDYPLTRNEKIVLYSDGGIHAAQAWFLLKAADFPSAFTLLGGLDAWKDEVLFPALPEQVGPDQVAIVDRMRHVSEFFGGRARGAEAVSADAAPLPLPKVDASAQAPVAQRKPKRKEGC